MRPFQRRLLVVLVVVSSLVLILGILFCVLVYNPFEGSLGSIVEIVPKGVSLYVTKPEPGRALRGFLSSPFLANLEECSSWKAFIGSETFRQLDETYSIQSGVEQLLQAPQKAPIDVWEELLGREAALACFPRNDKISRWDFLLYTRVGWKVRAGIDWSTSSLVASRLGRDVSLTKLDDGGVDATWRSSSAKRFASAIRARGFRCRTKSNFGALRESPRRRLIARRFGSSATSERSAASSAWTRCSTTRRGIRSYKSR
ncbi:MAG: hypothetical protein HYR85_11660 [Planctomycetes bacterium]|nr:hypothetical protein [Planctomycetota bacterium]